MKYKDITKGIKNLDSFVVKTDKYKELEQKLSKSYDLLKDCVYALNSGTSQDQELLADGIKYFLEARK